MRFSLWLSRRFHYVCIMDWAGQCAAVIPCFNEAPHIHRVVRQVRRHLPRVFVVDDGSSDGTSRVAAGAGAEVIRHAFNLGKGMALRTGWRHAFEHGFKWALTLDGDGQHSPDDGPNFFARAERGASKLVVGNRMDRPGTMPPLRRRVNRWMTRRLSNLTGACLADSQCGFRLVHLETLARLSLTTRRFEIESELLTAFLGAGHLVDFVPIKVIYDGGASRIRPLADSYRWACWWFAERKKNFSVPPSFVGGGLRKHPQKSF